MTTKKYVELRVFVNPTLQGDYIHDLADMLANNVRDLEDIISVEYEVITEVREETKYYDNLIWYGTGKIQNRK